MHLHLKMLINCLQCLHEDSVNVPTNGTHTTYYSHHSVHGGVHTCRHGNFVWCLGGSVWLAPSPSSFFLSPPLLPSSSLFSLCLLGLLKRTEHGDNVNHFDILYRYWPRRSWNITFRWTAKSYIFPRGYIFPKRAALRENIITRENITILAPPTRDISSVPVNICYIRWSKWMISSKFDGALWLSQSLVTRLGVCVQTMWTQTWQLCALSIMTFYC